MPSEAGNKPVNPASSKLCTQKERQEDTVVTDSHLNLKTRNEKYSRIWILLSFDMMLYIENATPELMRQVTVKTEEC